MVAETLEALFKGGAGAGAGEAGDVISVPEAGTVVGVSGEAAEALETPVMRDT